MYKVWDNVYDERELQVIWEVLEKIQAEDLWDDDEALLSSYHEETKENKRKGKGYWLGGAGYQIREDPDIHRINDVIAKIFRVYTGDYSLSGLWNEGILLTNWHQSILNYYEHTDKYSPHKDMCMFTALTWFYKEPRKFLGGELRLPQLGHTIELRSNRMIIIPGWLEHEVIPIGMSEEDMNKGLGRYSIATFMNINQELAKQERAKVSA